MTLPDRNQWQDLSDSQQIEQAQRIVKQLPAGWRFNGLRHCQMGDVEQNVAMFSSADNGIFAFVPGGEVTLGFDIHNWQPSQAELESYARTQDTWPEDPLFTMPLLDFIEKNTTPKRTATTQPLLVETSASDVYRWQEVAHDDWLTQEAFGYHLDTAHSVEHPHVQNALSQYLGDGDSINRSVSGMAYFKLVRGSDGLLRTFMKSVQSYQTIVDTMTATGFRFPTSDEWEYICGAGSDALFRWGNHFVTEPTSRSRWIDKEWLAEWKASGCLADSPIASDAEWNLHLCPNGFGILIAHNSFVRELVSQPVGVQRGGDGGQNQCAGTGLIPVWLTLATAYFAEDLSMADPNDDVPLTSDVVPNTIGRRILPLDPT